MNWIYPELVLSLPKGLSKEEFGSKDVREKERRCKGHPRLARARKERPTFMADRSFPCGAGSWPQIRARERALTWCPARCFPGLELRGSADEGDRVH